MNLHGIYVEEYFQNFSSWTGVLHRRYSDKSESINQSINQLGREGHCKHGMYESFLGWYLPLPSKVMITEQVLSKLKDW